MAEAALRTRDDDHDDRGQSSHGHGLAGLLDKRFGIAHFSFRMPDTVSWSPQMYALTGRAPQAAPLRLEDLVEPFHGDDRVRFAELVGQCLRDRQGWTESLRVRRPDGGLRWVEVAGDVVLDGEQLLGFNGLLRETVEPGTTLSTGDDFERAAALVKAMPIPAVLTDTEMYVKAYSSLWVKSHGVTSHDIIGADLIDVVPRAPVGWALEHAKAVAGQTIVGERTLHNPANGRPVRCWANLSPCHGADGKVIGVVTMVGWSDVFYISKDVATAMTGRR